VASVVTLERREEFALRPVRKRLDCGERERSMKQRSALDGEGVEVVVVFEVDCHDMLEGGGHGIAVRKGTTLIGTWAKEQPIGFKYARIVVNNVPWTFASDDVTITCPITGKTLPGEQERIASDSLRQARIYEDDESLLNAEHWYARALVEYEACGTPDLVLAGERLFHAELLLRLDKHSEAIVGIEWAISTYEQVALDANEEPVARIEAADQAVQALITLGTTFLRTGANEEQVRNVVARLLALQKLIQNRAAISLTLFLSVSELLYHLKEHARASSTFEQAQVLYQKQYAHRPNASRVTPLTVLLNRVETLLYRVENDIPVPLAEPPGDRQQGEATVLYDIASLVGWVYQGDRIELTKNGFLLKRARVKLRSFLQCQSRPLSAQEDEDGYPDMLVLSMENLGLLARSPYDTDMDEEKPFFEVGRLVPEWGTLALAEQCQYFLYWWSKTTCWWDASEQSSALAYYPLQPSRDARELLLSSLQRFPSGQWFALRSLLYLLWKQHPRGFLQERTYFSGRSGPLSFSEWERKEGSRFTGMLCTTLYELGLVSLSFPSNPLNSSSHRPLAFSLTEMGMAAITKEPFTEESGKNGKGSLVIQPTFDVLVLSPDTPTLYSLLPFCCVKHVGMASTLSLTKESVLRGRSAGISLDTMLSLLRKKSQHQEVPQNVAYTLNEWAAAFCEPTPPPSVFLEHVFLLRVGEERVAEALCQSSRLQALGVQRVGPSVLAIDLERASFQEIRKALKKEGAVVLSTQKLHRV